MCVCVRERERERERKRERERETKKERPSCFLSQLPPFNTFVSCISMQDGMQGLLQGAFQMV